MPIYKKKYKDWVKRKKKTMLINCQLELSVIIQNSTKHGVYPLKYESTVHHSKLGRMQTVKYLFNCSIVHATMPDKFFSKDLVQTIYFV